MSPTLPNLTSAEKPASVVVLLSGGLDSAVAIRMMLDQGLNVMALNFVSPFCTCSPRKAGGCSLAAQVARELGVELRVMAKGPDYLRIVEHPRFGTGRGLNPCIDCRIYMLRKAAALMAELGAVAVVTGEVLGQRPMSQHRGALDLIERESGLTGRLLRPLSAHHLPATIPEQEGTIRRETLLDLSGRTRSPQLALARERGVEVFGCPSGGCLLTDPAIARRLQDVFAHCPDWDERDARLATLGRHLRLHPELKMIIGRNAAENDRLEHLAGTRPRIMPVDVTGPSAVLCGTAVPTDWDALGRIFRRYTPKAGDGPLTLCRSHDGKETVWTAAEAATDEEIKRWTI